MIRIRAALALVTQEELEMLQPCPDQCIPFLCKWLHEVRFLATLMHYTTDLGAEGGDGDGDVGPAPHHPPARQRRRAAQ